MPEHGWQIVYHSFDADRERLREALCTLGNGKFATRGADEEFSAGPTRYPGTYLAGGYNRLESEVGGETVTNEDLVNFTNWLPLNFKPAGGDWVGADHALVEWRKALLMRDGVLERTVIWRDPDGRETRVRSRRLVHMSRPHYAAIEYSVTPLNWSGQLTVRSALDAGVHNVGVERYRQLAAKHLVCMRMGQVAPEGIYVVVQTTQSRLEVATAARTRFFDGSRRLEPTCEPNESAGQISQDFTLTAAMGKTIRVEKIVALYSSRDRGITEPGLDARLAITRAPDFSELLRMHCLTWKELWRTSDIVLAPNGEQTQYEEEQRILRLHIFHLLQTVSPHSSALDVSVPARGLHGEAYRGHIFWDEIFIHPFYTFRLPEVCKSLLLYRYYRLESARALAREAGYQGAMYPWQSSSDGREQTQTMHLNPLSGRWIPDYSSLQRHINAAIAHDVWFYFHSTRDHSFLERYGAEMLLEIAKFWASITSSNPQSERYEINGVMGPDEYHEKYPDAVEGGLKNNAYTNVMAVWCIDRALDTLSLLHPARRAYFCDLLQITSEDIARWRHIGERMTVPFHGEGFISQFEGYENLPEFDWEGYRKKYGNIERLDRILKAEGDSPDRYKVSKQADACMLFYLLNADTLRGIFQRLGYPFEDDTIRRNVEYYLPRTSHGSTLSKVVFASILDSIDRSRGFQLFRQALRSDIDDIQGGTTPEGIHLGAMAGTVNIVLSHFAGVDTTGEHISFTPRLPEGLRGIHFRIQHGGRWLEVRAADDRFRLLLDDNEPASMRVVVNGRAEELAPGSWREFSSGDSASRG